jgi:D-alanyl-D-alanine carboxypeptidase/D-alanyl-D-alanine-endopeptidase (penicillin-binding protein 4)
MAASGRRVQIVLGLLWGAVLPLEARAQSLSPSERAAVDSWFGEAVARTPGGEWGVAIGTMDGQVLWSASPDLELIPASTTKVFTTGFTRARMGGSARITTRVVGEGRVDSASGRWQGSWAIELGGDPTLERAGRGGRRSASSPGSSASAVSGSSRARSR